MPPQDGTPRRRRIHAERGVREDCRQYNAWRAFGPDVKFTFFEPTQFPTCCRRTIASVREGHRIMFQSFPSQVYSCFLPVGRLLSRSYDKKMQSPHADVACAATIALTQIHAPD